MIFRIIVCCSLLLQTQCQFSPKQTPPMPMPERMCLTGYMTEVQQWVDAKGVLIPQDDYDSAIDLSSNLDPVPLLQIKMTSMRRGKDVRYLSMARCRLTEVPTVFKFTTSNGEPLSHTLEYLTFFGNNFADETPSELYEAEINATQPWEQTVDTPWLSRPTVVHWSINLRTTEFPQLKELDLRACAIQVLDDNIFQGMPNLESLYIGENRINYIYGKVFVGLNNLVHLDFTYNEPCDDTGHELPLVVESSSILAPLKKLTSLDFSHTKLPQRLMFLFYYISRRMTRLSLCESGLTGLHDEIFKNTSLRILDLSGNDGILNRNKSLSGLENSLQILYAKDTGLKTMTMFKNFGKLEVIDLSINEITVLDDEVAATLKSLQILNLEKNRFIAWFTPVFTYMKSLKLLALKENNINLITDEMVDDISNVEYVALSRNFIVCNCHSRDFINIALRNERRLEHGTMTEMNKFMKIHEAPVISYHKAFEYYNSWIAGRTIVTINCTECDDAETSDEQKANFLLLDYHPGVYTCLSVPESKSVEFMEVDACNRNARIDYEIIMLGNRNKLFFLLTVPSFLIMLVGIYVFRRNLRYCIITVKNSTMLSLVHKGEFIDDTTIFHYDVFVSYCNEDRDWVLDHLLPHLESDCSISACLHERDFQVGSSILENIVSCMDRSRSIMLIISRRFLLSQWCQFEMHLAQHRLLETRREDLTLVLLEDVPRRLRPNTLHYLMLTKTYIVWPKDDNERKVFWRRLKKTLVTLKQKQSALEGVSLA